MHAKRKLPLGEDVKPQVIARGTPGFSGADLANLVNEAALFAARANRRIDKMIWFLIRDEARIGNGWQSGLYTATGRRKPSWQAFRRMPK